MGKGYIIYLKINKPVSTFYSTPLFAHTFVKSSVARVNRLSALQFKVGAISFQNLIWLQWLYFISSIFCLYNLKVLSNTINWLGSNKYTETNSFTFRTIDDIELCPKIESLLSFPFFPFYSLFSLFFLLPSNLSTTYLCILRGNIAGVN